MNAALAVVSPVASNIGEAQAALEKQGSPAHPEDPAPEVSRWLPVALSSALFMDLLDTSALGSALPTLAREFAADPLHLKLALTAYLLTMAIFVPMSGWLADRYGARRVFVNAMKVYLIGSVCCGLSSSVPELVAARVLQGLGGAMMTPVARLIVVASTPRERLVQALNAFTIPAVIGPLLGPPIAGLLLDVASWRWIFFVNLPVGLAGMWAVLRLVPRLRHPHPGRFDAFGFVLAGIAITAFVTLAEMVGTQVVSWRVQVAVALTAIAGFAIYALHARRAAAPMLELKLLATPTYRASLVGSTIVRLGLGATPFLVPLQLQLGLGWSALKSGTVMIAMIVGSIVARFVGTWAVRHLGFRATLIATGIATGITTAAPSLFHADTPALVVAGVLAAMGFARATFFVAASALTFADVSADQVSRASTLSTVVQQLGLSLGVSVAGAALAWSKSTASALTLDSFVAPFVVFGIAALATVPTFARLGPNVAEQMRGRRHGPQ
jgi:EmrB/QacA subfamily drug resistance transporter